MAKIEKNGPRGPAKEDCFFMDTPTLGARLKQARVKAGLTQKDAADALGVTYQAVSNYERDKCKVASGILKQLCVLYHVSTTELLQSADWTPEQEAVYRNAETEAEKLSLFDLWGVPEDRQEEYAGLRRLMGLDNAPLTPEDGLYGARRAFVDDQQLVMVVAHLLFAKWLRSIDNNIL